MFLVSGRERDRAIDRGTVIPRTDAYTQPHSLTPPIRHLNDADLRFFLDLLWNKDTHWLETKKKREREVFQLLASFSNSRRERKTRKGG